MGEDGLALRRKLRGDPTPTLPFSLVLLALSRALHLPHKRRRGVGSPGEAAEDAENGGGGGEEGAEGQRPPGTLPRRLPLLLLRLAALVGRDGDHIAQRLAQGAQGGEGAGGGHVAGAGGMACPTTAVAFALRTLACLLLRHHLRCQVVCAGVQRDPARVAEHEATPSPPRPHAAGAVDAERVRGAARHRCDAGAARVLGRRGQVEGAAPELARLRIDPLVVGHGLGRSDIHAPAVDVARGQGQLDEAREEGVGGGASAQLPAAAAAPGEEAAVLLHGGAVREPARDLHHRGAPQRGHAGGEQLVLGAGGGVCPPAGQRARLLALRPAEGAAQAGELHPCGRALLAARHEAEAEAALRPLAPGEDRAVRAQRDSEAAAAGHLPHASRAAKVVRVHPPRPRAALQQATAQGVSDAPGEEGAVVGDRAAVRALQVCARCRVAHAGGATRPAHSTGELRSMRTAREGCGMALTGRRGLAPGAAAGRGSRRRGRGSRRGRSPRCRGGRSR